MALVKSLESFRGCEVRITGRRVGFNGLSICQGNIVRKIELKTVDKSDYWFAINGVYGIESLCFDPQYYLYFVLANPDEQRIVVAQAVPFMKAQIASYNADIVDDMREWLDQTKSLSTKSGLSIIPRINFKLRAGIRTIVQILEEDQGVSEWAQCIDSIWRLEPSGSWTRTFPL